jgi:hypothetical protein
VVVLGSLVSTPPGGACDPRPHPAAPTWAFRALATHAKAQPAEWLSTDRLTNTFEIIDVLAWILDSLRDNDFSIERRGTSNGSSVGCSRC